MPEKDYYPDGERRFDSVELADAAGALLPKRAADVDWGLRVKTAHVYATLAVFAELRALRKEIERSQL